MVIKMVDRIVGKCWPLYEVSDGYVYAFYITILGGICFEIYNEICIAG